MSGWLLAGTTFFASGVEFVEAATIVLAVGTAVAWRTAIAGTLAAVGVLMLLVGFFSPLLANAGSLRTIQLIVGPFLILFGIGWLRKAAWRFAGLKSQRDEEAAFARELGRLRDPHEAGRGFAVAFQGVFVEGLEVAVIVVTFAASRPSELGWSIGGALLALLTVSAAAIALRKPFARVPENGMKAVVGVMLFALGTFWTGQGLGLNWWAGDATLFILAIGIAILATATALALRSVRAPA